MDKLDKLSPPSVDVVWTDLEIKVINFYCNDGRAFFFFSALISILLVPGYFGVESLGMGKWAFFILWLFFIVMAIVKVLPLLVVQLFVIGLLVVNRGGDSYNWQHVLMLAAIVIGYDRPLKENKAGRKPIDTKEFPDSFFKIQEKERIEQTVNYLNHQVSLIKMRRDEINAAPLICALLHAIPPDIIAESFHDSPKALAEFANSIGVSISVRSVKEKIDENQRFYLGDESLTIANFKKDRGLEFLKIWGK